MYAVFASTAVVQSLTACVINSVPLPTLINIGIEWLPVVFISYNSIPVDKEFLRPALT